MDIRQLRYFLRICSDGSILKASQNVFITQQALSKIISAMEQEIGAPLFFRSSRGLVPTEIGLQLKKLAQPVVDAMDKLNEEISSAVQLQATISRLVSPVDCNIFFRRQVCVSFRRRTRTFRFSLRKVTAANAKRSLPPVTILPR